MTARAYRPSLRLVLVFMLSMVLFLPIVVELYDRLSEKKELKG